MVSIALRVRGNLVFFKIASVTPFLRNTSCACGAPFDKAQGRPMGMKVHGFSLSF